MSVYGELDPMIEHRTQFAFKGKREHIAKVNMPNIAYPNQHIDNEILHGNNDMTSTDKVFSVVNNVGRALVKKRYSCLVEKNLIRFTTQIFMTHTKSFT